MSGRDEEFKRQIKQAVNSVPHGGVILGDHGAEQAPQRLPDPRVDIPLTLTEVTFRNTWHQWAPLMLEEDGELTMKVVYLEIIDPKNSTVYKYGLAPEDLDGELRRIQEMIAVRDHGVQKDADAPTG